VKIGLDIQQHTEQEGDRRHFQHILH